MQPETNSILSTQPSLDLRGQLAASQQPQTPDSGTRFSEEFDRATQRESGTDAEVRHDSRREAKATEGQRTERQATADQARDKAKSRRGEAADNRGERSSRRTENTEDARSELAGPMGTLKEEGPTRQQANRRIQTSAGQAQGVQQPAQDPAHQAQKAAADPQANSAGQAAMPQAAPGVQAGVTGQSNTSQTATVQAAAPTAGNPSQGSGTTDGGQLGSRSQAKPAAQTADAPVKGNETRDAMEQLLVDREARMDREASILRQIKASLKPGGRELSIRLSPAALGRVDMTLAMREGRLTATVRTESAEAHEAIERQLPELRAALENQGIEVMSFELELTAEGEGRGSFESRTGDQNLSAPATGNTRLPDAADKNLSRDLAADFAAARATNAQTRGGIDAIG